MVICWGLVETPAPPVALRRAQLFAVNFISVLQPMKVGEDFRFKSCKAVKVVSVFSVDIDASHGLFSGHR